MSEQLIGGAGRGFGAAGARRVAKGGLALVVALGFALGIVAASPQATLAAPKGGFASPGSCNWFGVNYDSGAVVQSNGFRYTCRNGMWVSLGFASSAADSGWYVAP